MRTLNDLRQKQALPLEVKISLTRERIRQWVNEYGEDGVYISFSGGKDSTVLLDIVRNVCGYTDVPAVFIDVPTQYPELREFATSFDNVEVIKPKIGFMEVCGKYGFPLISKEVSESVAGAKKYLTSIINGETVLTDRQTDRQVTPYHYCYERITGTGKYQRKANTPNYDVADAKAMYTNSRGGYDRKYRRLRGIGEFVKSQDDQPQGRKQSKTCDHVGNANKGQNTSDKGKYP